MELRGVVVESSTRVPGDFLFLSGTTSVRTRTSPKLLAVPSLNGTRLWTLLDSHWNRRVLRCHETFCVLGSSKRTDGLERRRFDGRWGCGDVGGQSLIPPLKSSVEDTPSPFFPCGGEGLTVSRHPVTTSGSGWVDDRTSRVKWFGRKCRRQMLSPRVVSGLDFTSSGCPTDPMITVGLPTVVCVLSSIDVRRDCSSLLTGGTTDPRSDCGSVVRLEPVTLGIELQRRRRHCHRR